MPAAIGNSHYPNVVFEDIYRAATLLASFTDLPEGSMAGLVEVQSYP